MRFMPIADPTEFHAMRPNEHPHISQPHTVLLGRNTSNRRSYLCVFLIVSCFCLGLCAAGATGGNGGIAAAVIGVIGQPLPTISELTTTTTTAMTNVSSANSSPEKGSFGNGLEEDAPPTVNGPSLPTLVPPSPLPPPLKPPPPPPPKRKKESADSKRERKAAKTLAIITGAFVICWLPFFIMAILLPICSRYQCQLNQYLIAFFLWLGYFNSTLNPIIYTIFSPEFRHAFKRILCGRKNSVRRRNRHLGVRHMH
ncbi:unnamed protein product [Bemisia tabaci]|uniref:G-protein coupled receptors family 1 profile domain-containing protein n=1 Tax=Bemisia tabaci TaxID=7038 RepID=A0A9P0CFH2_BEMTA|nr:unnamed protein product [Bemisia tabaci]CAH0777964.1 unnamed protein product [Bemisia tabaci]